MINLKWIRTNKELFIEKMQKRNFDKTLIDKLFQLYEKMTKIDFDLNQLRRERNLNTDSKEKSLEQADKNKELRELIKVKQAEFTDVESQLYDCLKRIPNILDDSVPFGKNDSENLEIRRWNCNREFLGNKFQYEFLNENLLEQIREMSASRFIGFNNKLSILHRSIANLALDFLRQEGFEEHSLPCVLNMKAMERSGHVPFFQDDIFWLENKDFALIPTSEVSIANLIKDRRFNKNQLPLKICSYSPCFRKEAGAAGKDTRGMIRLHQFHKVEIFSICKQEESENMQELMVSVVEKLLQQIGLTYRVILLCSGDTGFHSSKTYDLEVWMPVSDRFLEISSCSNVKDYQSNRLMSKYQAGPDNLSVHTLNGSCLPIERTMAAILENFQDENGNIYIPEVLRKYTGFDVIEFPKN